MLSRRTLLLVVAAVVVAAAVVVVVAAAAAAAAAAAGGGGGIEGSEDINMSAAKAALNTGHKLVAASLVGITLWGTYTVATGSTIILKRRFDRMMAEKEDAKNLEPVEPGSG